MVYGPAPRTIIASLQNGDCSEKGSRFCAGWWRLLCQNCCLSYCAMKQPAPGLYRGANAKPLVSGTAIERGPRKAQCRANSVFVKPGRWLQFAASALPPKKPPPPSPTAPEVNKRGPARRPRMKKTPAVWVRLWFLRRNSGRLRAGGLQNTRVCTFNPNAYLKLCTIAHAEMAVYKSNNSVGRSFSSPRQYGRGTEYSGVGCQSDSAVRILRFQC